MKPWRVPYPKFGKGPGLDRVRRVAEALGVNLAAFGASGAVVVGSNGKGSTAVMTAALLELDSPTGLFTSPHLFDLNERFRIDGEDIGDDELTHHWSRVAAGIQSCGLRDEFGGFEFLFLIAADWFAARGCAHTVWEAGIGGRLDPVRTIEARQLALTSLDLEHTELLGDTHEAIAREKLDAAPRGATVFIAPSCLPQRGAIEAHCASIGATSAFVSVSASAPLYGAHQRENAALALSLALAIAPIDYASAQTALQSVRWPGRLDLIETRPLIVIDVGHTPAGVRAALAGFIDLSLGCDATLICGVSGDKDVDVIVSILAPAFSRIICASARHKGAPSVQVAKAAAAANPHAEIVLAEDVADARRVALDRMPAGPLYVAGGLFLAAEFKAVHMGRDPASLAFF